MRSAAGQRPVLVNAGKPSRRLAALLGIASLLLGLLALLLFRSERAQLWLLEREPVSKLRSDAAQPSSDPRVDYVLGRVLTRRREYQEAAASFERCLARLQEGDGSQFRLRVEGELAFALAQLGDEREAPRIISKVLNADPGNVPAHFALGQLFMRRKRYELAVKEFQIVNILEPDNPEGWYQLGRAHNAARAPELAEPALRKALKLRPHDSESLRELGDSLGYRSRFADAMKCFEEAVQANPHNQSAAGALARTRVLQARTPEEYRKAREALVPFADAGNGDPFFLGQLGILEAQFGNLKEAELHLKRALELTSNYPELNYSLSMVYTRQGRSKEADQVMQRFRRGEELQRKVTEIGKRLSLSPDDVQLNIDLEQVLQQQGRLDDAFSQLQYMLRHFPGNEQVRSELALFTRKHGSRFQSQSSPTP